MKNLNKFTKNVQPIGRKIKICVMKAQRKESLKMKKSFKIIAFLFFIAILVFIFFQIFELWNENTQAKSDSSNTSDVQLLARAINRRSKRRTI